MTEILITGGAGNLGSELAKKLVLNSDYKVIIVDNLLTGATKNLPDNKFPNWKFIKCDINNYNDIAAVMLVHSFRFVFHYAAVVGVQRALNNPLMVLRDIDGIKNILSLSKNTGVERVFYSSSSEVYGEPVEIPQNEDTTPLNSKLPYAIVKNLGEAYLRSYHREYDLNYTIFRFFNTYGPYQTLDFVVPKFIYAAVKNQNITIYGDGSQSRTFCYISDNVDTVVKVLEEGLVINEIINVGHDKEFSISELARVIMKVTESSSKIENLPALKEGDMSRRLPDVSKMKKILARELIDIKEGVSKILAKNFLN